MAFTVCVNLTANITRGGEGEKALLECMRRKQKFIRKLSCDLSKYLLISINLFSSDKWSVTWLIHGWHVGFKREHKIPRSRPLWPRCSDIRQSHIACNQSRKLCKFTSSELNKHDLICGGALERERDERRGKSIVIVLTPGKFKSFLGEPASLLVSFACGCQCPTICLWTKKSQVFEL